MTEEELRKGLDLTYKNALRLYEEANGLFIFERYSRAYALSQLASEEIGKALIIYHAILDFYNGVTINKEYFESKQFRDHKTKIKKVILIQMQVFTYMSDKLEHGKEILKKLAEQYENAKKIDVKKNQSLYVGIENENFIFPDDVITKEMANELAVLTALSIKGIEPMIQQSSEVLKEVAAGLSVQIKEVEAEEL